MLLESPNDGAQAGCAGAWALFAGTAGAPQPQWIDPDSGYLPPDFGRSALWLWAGRLSPAVPLAEFASLAGLNAAETERLAAFRHDKHRFAYAAAHGALRLALAGILRCAPADVRFRAGRHGKPALCPETHGRADGLQFSISHTDGLSALAVARRPVGIDVETMRWKDDLMDIARGHFAADQAEELESCAAADRGRLFFRRWTLGEALIKATGMGLRQKLDGFAFTSALPPRLARLEPQWGPADHWHFGTF